MKFYFDTSVLAPALATGHPNHIAAFSAVAEACRPGNVAYMGMHSVAEVFSSLTRLPVSPRIRPSEAAQIIEHDLVKRFEIVPITADDYLASVAEMGKRGFAGGLIYDLLLLRCAEKCNPDKILTFNLKHFMTLAPASIAGIISVP